MKNDYEKIFGSLKKIRFDDDEKSEVRQRILNAIVEEGVKERNQTLINPFRFFRFAAATLLLILIIGGGISLAAESSLPGNLLFPLKVSLNENLKMAFAFSDKEKAFLDIRIAQKRLQDTEKLISLGKMTPTAKQQIETSFKERASSIKKYLEKAEAKGNTGDVIYVSSDFESTLKTHKNILTSVSERKNSSAGVISIVNSVSENRIDMMNRKQEAKNNLRNKSDENEGNLMTAPRTVDSQTFSKTQSGSTDESITKVESQRAKVKAEKKIAEMEEKIFEKKDILGNAVDIIESKLIQAEKEIASGDTKFASGDYTDAFLSYQDSLGLSKEIEVIIEAKYDLKDDLELKLETDKKSEIKNE